jgi:hypothetical protein
MYVFKFMAKIKISIKTIWVIQFGCSPHYFTNSKFTKPNISAKVVLTPKKKGLSYKKQQIAHQYFGKKKEVANIQEYF